MMRKFLSVTALALSCLAPATAQADVVVELYTSQGCSSCPPADEMLRELASHEGVIALALHVDYWDYIGWRDRFADPAHTVRQRNYARAAGGRTIYTPQFIIAGQGQVIGARGMELMDEINAHRNDPSANMELSLEGEMLTINVRALARPRDVVVQLVRYSSSETVDILRGENAGETITYANIVTSWQVLSAWDGTGSINIQTPVRGTDGAVVIVQLVEAGAILAAEALN